MKIRVLLSLLLGLGQSGFAATVTWSSATGSAWLTNTNWAGSAVPGVNDIAQFDNNPTSGGASNGVGVNYSNAVNNGTFAGSAGTLPDEAVGAIVVTSARTNSLYIGNTKSTNSGYMTLNGASVNGQSNTVLSNSSAQALTIQNNVQGSTGTTFGLVLGGTANFVQTAVGTASANGSLITINSNIDQANAGSSITLLGNGTSSLAGGVLELAGTSSFTGGITVGNAAGGQAGTVKISGINALPATGSVTVNNNSQLLLSVSGTFGGTTQQLVLNGVGTIANSGALRGSATGVTWKGNVSFGSDTIIAVTNSNDLTLSGSVADNGFQLQKQGAGLLTLSKAGNVMTGSTVIGNGTLAVASNSSMGTGSLTMASSGTTSPNSTVLNLNNPAQSIGNLSSSFEASSGSASQVINLNGTALTVVQTGTTTFGTGSASALTSIISGSGSLILGASSTGLLTLTGNNTYTGSTTVSGGTLVVSGSLSATSAVTVSGGTLKLGIDNAFASSAKVILGAGVLAAANKKASFSDLTVSGSATLDLGVGSNASALHFADSSANTWSGTLTISNWNGLSVGGGADEIFFGSTGAGLTNGQLTRVVFLNPIIDGVQQTGNYGGSLLGNGEIVAVPEPATWTTIVGGLGMLGFWRRLRRNISSR